jgi:hypothetical protein
MRKIKSDFPIKVNLSFPWFWKECVRCNEQVRFELGWKVVWLDERFGSRFGSGKRVCFFICETCASLKSSAVSEAEQHIRRLTAKPKLQPPRKP